MFFYQRTLVFYPCSIGLQVLGNQRHENKPRILFFYSQHHFYSLSYLYVHSFHIILVVFIIFNPFIITFVLVIKFYFKQRLFVPESPNHPYHPQKKIKERKEEKTFFLYGPVPRGGRDGPRLKPFCRAALCSLATCSGVRFLGII